MDIVYFSAFYAEFLSTITVRYFVQCAVDNFFGVDNLTLTRPKNAFAANCEQTDFVFWFYRLATPHRRITIIRYNILYNKFTIKSIKITAWAQI